MSRLWILPFLGLIAFLGFACGRQGDYVPASATPAASPSNVTTPAPSATTTSIATVPADWLTYKHPTAGFSFRYPPDWSLQEYAGEPQARVASFDLATWHSPGYPPGGILIDFVRVPLSQAGPRPTDAADASLGTLPGWTRHQAGTGEGPWAKSVTYAVDSGEYAYSLSADFDQADADESVAQSIASTFAVSN